MEPIFCKRISYLADRNLLSDAHELQVHAREVLRIPRPESNTIADTGRTR
jgi:hypothetical protein